MYVIRKGVTLKDFDEDTQKFLRDNAGFDESRDISAEFEAFLNKRGIDLNEGHRLPDLLNQCNPCVMCSSNPFHCDEMETCNAINKWVELVDYIEMLNKSDSSKENYTIEQYGEIKELRSDVKNLQAALNRACDKLEIFSRICSDYNEDIALSEDWKEWCIESEGAKRKHKL